jgi:tRNA U34 5-carboxymethylaminomethyl modifying enzyme MnmG/GidA
MSDFCNSRFTIFDNFYSKARGSDTFRFSDEMEESDVPCKQYATGAPVKVRGNSVQYHFISYTKNNEAILANKDTNELVWVSKRNIDST